MDANTMEITWVRTPPFPPRPQRDCTVQITEITPTKIHAPLAGYLLAGYLLPRFMHQRKVSLRFAAFAHDRACRGPLLCTFCIARTRGCQRFQMSDGDDMCDRCYFRKRAQLSLAYINVFSSCLTKYKSCIDALPPIPLEFVAFAVHICTHTHTHTHTHTRSLAFPNTHTLTRISKHTQPHAHTST
jgi:hypothetical protein